MAGRDAAVLTVSVAAQLAGMHAQTVRQYDRLGLVQAKRTRGGGRRYSLNDVDRLSQDEGVNLAGIAKLMLARDREQKLRQHIRQLEKVVAEQKKELEGQRGRESRVFAVGGDGSVFVVARESIRSQLPDAKPRRSGEIVVWRPERNARGAEFVSDARETGLDDAV